MSSWFGQPLARDALSLMPASCPTLLRVSTSRSTAAAHDRLSFGFCRTASNPSPPKFVSSCQTSNIRLTPQNPIHVCGFKRPTKSSKISVAARVVHCSTEATKLHCRVQSTVASLLTPCRASSARLSSCRPRNQAATEATPRPHAWSTNQPLLTPAAKPKTPAPPLLLRFAAVQQLPSPSKNSLSRAHLFYSASFPSKQQPNAAASPGFCPLFHRIKTAYCSPTEQAHLPISTHEFTRPSSRPRTVSISTEV